MHRLLGSLGIGSAIVGAVGPLSSDTVILLAAAVVFGLATMRSRAPGLLRQDNQALAARVKTLEREKTDALAEQHKAAGELIAKDAQLAELRAKDTSALYDLMVTHTAQTATNGAEVKQLLERILVEVTAPAATA